MSSSVAELDTAIEEMEAYQELLSHASKRTGKIRPEVLVRHVMTIVPAPEWPVRVEAMDALIRRIESIKQEKLRVESRPAEGRLLGMYATRRPGSGIGPIARCSSGSIRSKGVAIARISSRTRWASASTCSRFSIISTPVRASCSRQPRSRNGPTARNGRACGGTRSGR